MVAPEAAAPDIPEAEVLRQRVLSIRSRIANAARKASRLPDAVGILLATKTQSAPAIRLAQDILADAGGHRPRLGENRSREGCDKAGSAGLRDARWSMIGHVQSNKVEEVLAFATEVQSLDRISLAVALDKKLQAAGRSLDVLVQVKTAREDSKFGLVALSPSLPGQEP